MSFQIRVPYQGYVQAQGFRPAQAPDTTRQLRQNAQVEQQNIKREYDQVQAFQGQMQAAKQQREQIESAMELAELQEFSGTIAGLVQQGAQALVDNEQAIGRAQAAKNLPEQQRLAQQQYDKEFEAAKAQGMNDMDAAALASKGYGYAIINNIKGRGGHRGNAQLTATLDVVGKQLPSKIKSQLNSLKDEQGNPLVTPMTTPAEYAGMLEEIIQANLAPFGDINQDFRAAHIDKHVDPARQKLLEAHSSLHNKSVSFKEKQDIKNLLAARQITMDQALLRLSTELDDSKSKETYLGLGGAWRVMESFMKEAIDAGQMDANDIYNMFDGASDGKQTYAKRFPRKLQAMLDYEQKKFIQDGEQTLREERLAINLRDKEIGDEVVAKEEELGRRLTEDELADMYGDEERKNGTKFPFLENYRGGYSWDDQAKEQAREVLEQAAMGGYLTSKLVQSIPDWRLQQEFLPEAIKQETKKRGTEYDKFAKGIDGEIKNIFSIGPNDNMTVEAEAVRQAARADYDNRYEVNLATMPPPMAAQVAAFEVSKDIAAGAGIYKRQPKPDPSNRFPMIGVDANADAKRSQAQAFLAPTQKMLNNHGKAAIGMPGTFGTKEEVQATLKHFSETGHINDARIRYTASIMDENRYHVLRRAAEAYELKVEFPEPRALKPGSHRILNNEPTAKQIQRQKIANGIQRTSTSTEFAWVPTAAQGLTPMERAWLRTIRYAEGTHTNQGYGTHFGGSYSEPGAAHPDRVITAGGYSSAAYGAYQFMPKTWQSTGGGAMTPERQDKAALELMRRRGVTGRQGLTPELAAKLAPEWASFPNLSGNSHYGQPVKSYRQLERFFLNALSEEQFGTY